MQLYRRNCKSMNDFNEDRYSDDDGNPATSFVLLVIAGAIGNGAIAALIAWGIITFSK